MIGFSFFLIRKISTARNSEQLRGRMAWNVALVAFSLLACLFGWAIAPSLEAQVVSGFTGTVVDPTGAVLPGATVTATNEATHITVKAASTAEGVYALSALAPGTYTLTVSAPGFSRYVRSQIVVGTGVVSTIDVSMEVGSASQSVNVRSESIALNTTQPQINTVLEPALLNALPIELSGYARQIDQFVFLTPGVQGDSWNKNTDGGLNFQSGLVLNGIPIVQVNMQGQQTYMNPPFEMVREFSVVQSTFSAQYGLGQGVATYQMASGTNQLHGDAFEINRNSFFDSDGFFASNFNAQGKPIPPVDHQNDYGFTIGGPLTVPGLYNGRDRTFFHISTDWFEENQALTSFATVPTAAMKQGDFSHFVDAGGNQIPIYDPTTGQQFPGNQIPTSRFSAIAQSILPLIPNPDRTGTVYGQQSNISPLVHSEPFDQTLWGFTVDHHLTTSQNVRFSMWEDNQHETYYAQAPFVPSTNELQSSMDDYNYASGYLLDYSKTVSPNLVATAGMAWVGILDGQGNGGPAVTNFPGVQDSQYFPGVTFNGQNPLTPWGVDSGYIANRDRELGISLVNNWLWTHGAHSLNIGWEYRRGYDDTRPDTAGAGQVNFSQAETSVPDPSNPNFYSWGSSFASFLLGSVDSASRTNAIETRIHSVAFSPYIQDNWKIDKRLTLNLGLRWDIMVPFEESNNNILFMDPHLTDPGAGNLPGGVAQFGSCIGCAGINRASIHWRNFGPRLGFSYQLNNRTVLQAGAFIVFLNDGAYDFASANVASSMSPLFAGQFTRSSTGSNVPGYGDWDDSPIPNPAPAAYSPSIGNGTSISYFDPSRAGMAPYEQAWSANVQRQLPWNMFVNVAYVGNHDVHLPAGINLVNQPSPSVLRYGSLLSQQVNSPTAQAAGIATPYPSFVSQFGASATVLQALRPFPQYSGINNIYDMAGTTEYNALQAQAEKRFSNGLGFLASETFAQALTNQDRLYFTFNYSVPLNTFNQRAEWGIAANDQKYLTRLVATYQLPVGAGKMFLSHGIAADVLGGWQVSGIGDYEGGFPFGVIDNFAGINGYNRPNIVPGTKIKTYNYGAVKDYFVGRSAKPPVMFTTNAFALTPSPYVLGNGIRAYSGLRTPPLRNESFSAMKSFRWGEKATGTLRVDYFNAFNRTQFSGPDSDMSDSTFGTVTGEYSQITNRQGQATFRIDF
jgi:Carboxypeptidase regulatory-like domain